MWHRNLIAPSFTHKNMTTQIESRRLRSCLFIANLLRRFERLTLAQISHYWQQSADVSDGRPLARSSFNDYRRAIADLFGLYIECDHRTHQYYIELSADDDLSEWVLSSFSLASLTQEGQEVKQRILLDAPPQGMQYFTLVVEAFRAKCCLKATYQKFGAEPYDCLLRPYVLKTYKGRWYLLCQKNDETALKVMALDRFTHMQLLPDVPFDLPDGFSPQQHFAHSFGIYVNPGVPPTVRLRAHGQGRNYLRLSPMHPTQREEQVDDETSDFLMQCHTTPDLTLELLRQGHLIEVMEPASLRQAVAEELQKCYKIYNEGLNL